MAITRWVFLSAFWFLVVGLSGLLIWNSLPYFDGKLQHAFFLEKAFEVAQSLWLYAFYIHVGASILCLLAALSQFSSRVLKWKPMVHVVSGRIYGGAVLLLAGPSGIYLSFFAKGGFLGFLGFFVLGSLWIFFTVKGIQTARKGKIKAHKEWMIRSYALALSALSFRAFHIFLFELGYDGTTNYLMSLWLSNFFNLAAAELVIHLNQAPKRLILNTEI